MALIYPTTLNPTKYELLAAWLPSQPWFTGDISALEPVGAYRFDDPAGEVGMEGHLFIAGDERIYHAPLTYRAAGFADAESHTLGTTEHGVLGTRWFIDGAADPVYRTALATAIAHGAHGAEEIIEEADGSRRTREPSVRVEGSGRPALTVPDFGEATIEQVGQRTRIEQDLSVLDVIRVIEPGLRAESDQLTLSGFWEGQTEPAVLALLLVG